MYLVTLRKTGEVNLTVLTMAGEPTDEAPPPRLPALWRIICVILLCYWFAARGNGRRVVLCRELRLDMK